MQGYDYPALHLFLLPVFWRASISIHENLQHKELHYLHMKHLTVSTAGVKNLPV
jgi:glutathionyl-hydroquinone reductase